MSPYVSLGDGVGTSPFPCKLPGSGKAEPQRRLMDRKARQQAEVMAGGGLRPEGRFGQLL